MDCQEREELEAIITAVLDRRDELNKISSDDPNFGQYKQEIEKLSIRARRAQEELLMHRDVHGCS
jgi:hypothetical protein